MYFAGLVSCELLGTAFERRKHQWHTLDFVALKRFGCSHAALVQRGLYRWLIREAAGKGGPISQFNLHIGSISGILMDAQGLDGFARKLRTLDVVFPHRYNLTAS